MGATPKLLRLHRAATAVSGVAILMYDVYQWLLRLLKVINICDSV